MSSPGPSRSPTRPRTSRPSTRASTKRRSPSSAAGPRRLGEVGDIAVLRQDRRQVPHARIVGNEPQQNAWGGFPFSYVASAVLVSQVAPCKGPALRCYVALNQLGLAARLNPAERRNGLEYDQNASRIPPQVTELHVAFSDDYLERSIGPAKPDGRNQRASVLPVRRQDSSRRSFQQRTHAHGPVLRQGRIVTESLRREPNGSRSRERLPETGDHHEVGVLPHSDKAARPERRQAVLVARGLPALEDGWVVVGADRLRALDPRAELGLGELRVLFLQLDPVGVPGLQVLDENLARDLVLASLGDVEVDADEGVRVAVEDRGRAFLLEKLHVLEPVDVLTRGGRLEVDVLDLGHVLLVGLPLPRQVLRVDVLDLLGLAARSAGRVGPALLRFANVLRLGVVRHQRSPPQEAAQGCKERSHLEGTGAAEDAVLRRAAARSGLRSSKEGLVTSQPLRPCPRWTREGSRPGTRGASRASARSSGARAPRSRQGSSRCRRAAPSPSQRPRP